MGEICSKSWAVHLLDAWFQCLDQHWLWHNDDIVFACELERPRYQCWNKYFVNYYIVLLTTYWVFLIHNSNLNCIWKLEYFHRFRSKNDLPCVAATCRSAICGSKLRCAFRTHFGRRLRCACVQCILGLAKCNCNNITHYFGNKETTD